MKICFLLERGDPPRLNPVYADVFERLERQGVMVMRRYPEEELLQLDKLELEADLYALKSDAELALSLAIALEKMGARVLNRVNASLLSKDKVIAASVLLRAGIPTPRSWVAAQPELLQPALEKNPLILKPYRGYHGVGINVVEDPSHLSNVPNDTDLIFAQQYLDDQVRKDLKVFVIGKQVFGVRKMFSLNSYLHAGEPVSLSREVENLALRCGEAFGLELYGLDIAEDNGQAYVIDVNYFPGYRGVPDAGRHLSDYLLHSLVNEGGTV